MIAIHRAAAVAALLGIAVPTLAAPSYTVYAVQTGQETVRYRQGVPTLDLETDGAAVQVTPRAMDHGSLAFDIAVYNKGADGFNFDIGDIDVRAGDQHLAVFSKDQLIAKAKNRAIWSQIGMAVLAGAAAAAVANAHSTNSYRSRTYFPGYGTVTHVARWRDNSIGQLGVAASVAGGAIAIKGIQNRLDYTVQNLSDDVVQMNTIDGDSSYAGKIVVEKIKAKTLPQEIRIVVNAHGVPHAFAFRLALSGHDVPPAFTAVTKASAEPAVPLGVVVPPAAPPAAQPPAAAPAAQVIPVAATIG
jgi:hypothetical protein